MNEYQTKSFIRVETAERAKRHDRKHPMWSCTATDEMREAWTIVLNTDLHA